MRNERRTFAQRTTRGAALSLLGSVLLGAVATWLPACKEQSRTEEAVEELRDEAGDAKEQIEDEIDDHT